MRIVYPGQALSFLIPHIAATSESALRYHRRFYDWEPKEKVTVFVEDFSDFGHGGATSVPTNFINYGIAPFSYIYETVPAVDRLYWMANHELAHLATMDPTAGRDRRARAFFGGKVAPIAENPLSIFYNYLTSPRWNAPRWYHEGIAVFVETWMAGGLGRSLSPYDEMVFRSMVRDGAHFYDVVGLESEGTTVDFQVGVNSYLYGARFMSYLALEHGPDRLIEWTARRPGSKAHFAAQFQHVYGTDLDDEWRRWIEWEQTWQQDNLAAIRTEPTTPYETISSTALGSVSRGFVDDEAGKLYVAIRYPGQLAHLAALGLATGEIQKVRNLKGAALFYVTSLAWDPAERQIFYTSDNYEWRDLNVIDVDTGASRRLQRDARIGDLAFDPTSRALWGVRHFNGLSTLVRMPDPWTEWNQMRTFDYGDDLYDIDVSPDGRWLTGALTHVDGTQELVRFDTADLIAGDAKPEELFDFAESAASNFVFDPSGRYLYGSSFYSGVSNIFRYDFEAVRHVGSLEHRKPDSSGPRPLQTTSCWSSATPVTASPRPGSTMSRSSGSARSATWATRSSSATRR